MVHLGHPENHQGHSGESSGALGLEGIIGGTRVTIGGTRESSGAGCNRLHIFESSIIDVPLFHRRHLT